MATGVYFFLFTVSTLLQFICIPMSNHNLWITGNETMLLLEADCVSSRSTYCRVTVEEWVTFWQIQSVPSFLITSPFVQCICKVSISFSLAGGKAWRRGNPMTLGRSCWNRQPETTALFAVFNDCSHSLQRIISNSRHCCHEMFNVQLSYGK